MAMNEIDVCAHGIEIEWWCDSCDIEIAEADDVDGTDIYFHPAWIESANG